MVLQDWELVEQNIPAWVGSEFRPIRMPATARLVSPAQGARIVSRRHHVGTVLIWLVTNTILVDNLDDDPLEVDG